MNTTRKLDFIAKHGKEIPDEAYHKAIYKALKGWDISARVSAIRHPKVTKEHIDKALNDKSWYVRTSAKERLSNIE